MTLVETMLTEAINIGRMFNGLLATIEDPSERAVLKTACDEAATWAIRYLKRDDRVMWYLNIWKMCRFSLINYSSPEFKRLYDKQLDEYFEKTKHSPGAWTHRGQLEFAADDIDHNLRDNLMHFLSLPSDQIQNYRFGWQSVHEVFETFVKFETAWKKKAQTLIPHQEEQTILRFPDGYRWELLDRSSCSAEGEAMGHCGNTANPRQGDRLLSLRRLVEKNGHRFWEPSLTFILNKYGLLGEMKGRGNDKPAPRYHHHIVALLDLPLIKGIIGGGYLPENNFSLDDLGEDAKRTLLARKPELGSPIEFFNASGFTPALALRIRHALLHFGHPCEGFSEDGSTMFADKFRAWMGAVEEYGDRKAHTLIDTMNNVDEEETGATSQLAEHGVFDRLPRASRNKIGAYIAKKYPDEITAYEEEEETEFDPNFPFDVWKLIERLDGEILMSMILAAEIGIQEGRVQEMARVISDAFAQYDFPFPGMAFDWDTPNDRFDWNARVRVTVPTKTVCEILTDPKTMERLEDDGWMTASMTIDAPSHGFNDFDVKAAVDNFLTEYPDFAPDP